MMKKITLVFFILLPYFLFSQAPADYYNSAQGKTGSELKTALYNIIKGHKEFSYSALWDILSNIDKDSANTSDVILIYTGLSRAKTKHGGNLSLEYKVYNLTENLIKTGNFNNVKTQIDLSGLPNGLFLIRVSALSANWNKTYRIVKLDK